MIRAHGTHSLALFEEARRPKSLSVAFRLRFNLGWSWVFFGCFLFIVSPIRLAWRIFPCRLFREFSKTEAFEFFTKNSFVFGIGVANLDTCQDIFVDEPGWPQCLQTQVFCTTQSLAHWGLQNRSCNKGKPSCHEIWSTQLVFHC